MAGVEGLAKAPVYGRFCKKCDSLRPLIIKDFHGDCRTFCHRMECALSVNDVLQHCFARLCAIRREFAEQVAELMFRRTAMGMFDYVRCEAPLPDGFTGELQTKDFDREMVVHVISADGRLLLDRGHYEGVPKAERPYPDGDGLLGLCGSIRRIPKYEDANFHGYVNFYGTDEDENWHEYNAKFTDGQLVSIEFVSDD